MNLLNHTNYLTEIGLFNPRVFDPAVRIVIPRNITALLNRKYIR